LLRLFFSAAITVALGASAIAQDYGPNVFVPPSTRRAPDARLSQPTAHTNYLVYTGPPFYPSPEISRGIGGYTPDQIRSAYSMPSTGGSGKAIAIVDAYHYATSLNDFNVFSAQFGLPQESSTNPTSSSNRVFQVVYQGSSAPPADANWAQEEALDIEWAHALAPNAKIYLVEANSSGLSDLLACVDKASGLANVRAVSMSWGVDEFSTQAQYDSHFQHSKVVYFSASGDVGGVQSWPPASQYVVAVGGTSLEMFETSFLSESAWSDSGGGPSVYIGRPAFQHRIYMFVGGRRGCPDISSDADPQTGCAVYDSTPYSGMSGWLVFGGTSLSTPSVAGMYVTSGAPALNSYNELVRIYNAYGSASFRDISTGMAGPFHAVPGWDFVTGVGAPLGTTGF